MKKLLAIIILFLIIVSPTQSQTAATDIQFVRQAVKRIIFDQDQSISLASLKPEKIIGLDVMHPADHLGKDSARISIENGMLRFSTSTESETTMWLAGFNPFATYIMEVRSEERRVGKECRTSELIVNARKAV